MAGYNTRINCVVAGCKYVDTTILAFEVTVTLIAAFFVGLRAYVTQIVTVHTTPAIFLIAQHQTDGLIDSAVLKTRPELIGRTFTNASVSALIPASLKAFRPIRCTGVQAIHERVAARATPGHNQGYYQQKLFHLYPLCVSPKTTIPQAQKAMKTFFKKCDLSHRKHLTRFLYGVFYSCYDSLNSKNKISNQSTSPVGCGWLVFGLYCHSTRTAGVRPRPVEHLLPAFAGHISPNTGQAG